MKFPSQSVLYLLCAWSLWSTMTASADKAAVAAPETSSTSCTAAAASSSATVKAPYITAPDVFLLPDEDSLTVQTVMGCCAIQQQRKDQQCTAEDGGDATASASVLLTQVEIGQMPQFGTDQALQVLEQAELSWKGGAGVWTQMSLADRYVSCSLPFTE